MFDQPYAIQYLGKQMPWGKEAEILQIDEYRFTARNSNRYIVRLELLVCGVCAVKFYNIKDQNNRRKYEMEYGNEDPGRIIGTAIHTMFLHWQKKPETSFCFYAVPKPNHKNPRSRYKIYRMAMLNLFPSSEFIHATDAASSLYLLINKNCGNTEALITSFRGQLFSNYPSLISGSFDLGENNDK